MNWKKEIRYWAVLLLPSIGYAQGSITNSNANIVVNSTARIVVVEGAVTNQNTSTIANNGTIFLDGNWTQTETSTYTGVGKIEFGGAVNQSITSATPMVVSNLSVNNNNKLVLAAPITVATAVDLNTNGNIELGNNNLTLTSGAAINNYDASNYIITDGTGTLIQTVEATATVFPIGNTSYNPATLNNNGTTDAFRVRVQNQILEDGTIGTPFTEGVIDRTWLIEESVLGGSNVDLTLQWDAPQELPTFDRTIAGVVHYTNNSWSKPATFIPSTNVSGSTYSISRSGINSFSPFGVATQNANLPVELLAFDAKRNNIDIVDLVWTTASETNNKGFYIERMLDTENQFFPIGWVDGNGTTNRKIYYKFEDNNSHNGISYYRLGQVDFDGTIAYSIMRAVEGQKTIATMNVFPNPTVDQLNILLYNIKEGDAELAIYDYKGQQVFAKPYHIRNNQVIQLTDILYLSAGTYIVDIRMDNGDHFRKTFFISEY